MDGLTADGYWFTLHEEMDKMLEVDQPYMFEILDDSLSNPIRYIKQF